MISYINRTQASQLCFFGNGCLELSRSPFSSLLGYPLSLWGVGTVYVLAGGAQTLPRQGRLWLGYQGFALFAGGFAVYLQFVALFVARTPCLWCGTAALSIVGMVGLVLHPKTSSSRPLDGLSRFESSTFAFALVLVPAPLVLFALYKPSVRCIALSPSTRHALDRRTNPSERQKVIFVFTDFACPHCYKSVPGQLKAIRDAGWVPVALPVTKIPDAETYWTSLYALVARERGFGDQVVERTASPLSLQTFNRGLKQELKPTEAELLAARERLGGNNRLFELLRCPGTPSYARVRGDKVCVSTRPQSLYAK